jgi:O-antigen/teichoic acid export membrane protein
MAGVQLMAAWWLANPPVHWGQPWRRVRFLLRDSFHLIVAETGNNISGNADNILVGFFCGQAALGIYSFAYNQSLQTARLVFAGMFTVLFSALSKLSAEPARQLVAAGRAARALMVVGLPLGFLQAALAEPILRLIWHDRWVDSIAPLEILSLAMALGLTSSPVIGLVKARGHFGRYVIWTLAWAVFAVAAFTIGVRQSALLGVSWAVLLMNSLYSVLAVILFLSPPGQATRMVGQILGVPLLLGIISVGFPWGLAHQLVPRLVSTPLWRGAPPAGGVLVLATGVYVALLRWVGPDIFKEAMARLRLTRQP